MHCSYMKLIVFGHIFMAWYKIVVQHFILVYHGKSHLSLLFSQYIHTHLKACVYVTGQNEIQLSPNHNYSKIMNNQQQIEIQTRLNHSNLNFILTYNIYTRKFNWLLEYSFHVIPALHKFYSSVICILYIVDAQIGSVLLNFECAVD